MRLYYITAICLVSGLLIGCQENLAEDKTERNPVKLVNTLNNIGIENAILIQHTLYPYHFVPDGRELNELGERDLGVLARHFVKYPGMLNIRQGTTSPELYTARVDHVLSALKEAGVETGRITVSEGMAGGTGMPSEHVVTILKSADETKATSTGMITK